MKFPFLKPSPPRLSALQEKLKEIEDSSTFTNFGPQNSRFEAAATRELFGGTGHCLTVANATLGLMVAIRRATFRRGTKKRFAIMPSFTFAATGHAADWCGLEPLFCDVDPETWLPAPEHQRSLLDRYGDDVAVVVPYATFGNSLDLDWYERLGQEYGVAVVVDAAASLGSKTAQNRQFGRGSTIPIVYSMHATKTFATAEGGLIHSTDIDAIKDMRLMCNFGFGEPRAATMPGLNAKLTEVGALLASERLAGLEAIVRRRSELAVFYIERLKGLGFQRLTSPVVAMQFMPALLPRDAAPARERLIAALRTAGVELRSYFSPSLHMQPFFAPVRALEPLPVTEDLSARILSFPLYDAMSEADVATICTVFWQVFRKVVG